MDDAQAPTVHRSGFVSIVGRPSVGKSTLLNTLVGTKLAIVASKPQTTRTIVQGVLTRPDAQIVFLDTPGIHRGDTPLNKRMMRSVREALDQRDLLLYVIDAMVAPGNEEKEALDAVKKVETPIFLVLNKIDRVAEKPQLLALIEQYRELGDFREYYPISAQTGDGVDVLVQGIAGMLPEGPAFFPEDYLTDQPERFLAAELIRERIIHETKQEVPHAVAVLIEEWKETPRLTRIMATIVVERPGQKAIIIGSRGAMLKQIGTRARLEIETLLGRKIFLELFVKVREGWRENPQFLEDLDWRSTMGSGVD